MPVRAEIMGLAEQWDAEAQALLNEGYEQARLTTKDFTIKALADADATTLANLGTYYEFAVATDPNVERVVLNGTILLLKLLNSAGTEVDPNSKIILGVRHKSKDEIEVAASEIKYFPYYGTPVQTQRSKDYSDAYALIFNPFVGNRLKISHFDALVLKFLPGSGIGIDGTQTNFHIELTVFERRIG